MSPQQRQRDDQRREPVAWSDTGSRPMEDELSFLRYENHVLRGRLAGSSRGPGDEPTDRSEHDDDRAPHGPGPDAGTDRALINRNRELTALLEQERERSHHLRLKIDSAESRARDLRTALAESRNANRRLDRRLDGLNEDQRRVAEARQAFTTAADVRLCDVETAVRELEQRVADLASIIPPSPARSPSAVVARVRRIMASWGSKQDTGS